MTTKTDRRVIVENTCEHSLGTERPTSLFLRSPKKGRSAHLSRAEINESQVSETMRVWEAKGWLTITPAVEFHAKVKAVKDAREAETAKAKSEAIRQVKEPRAEVKGRFDVDEKISVGPDAKSEPKAKTVVGPPKKEAAKEPKPKEGGIVAPKAKENIPTVGSSEDGSPAVSEPAPASEPGKEPKAKAEVYTEGQLKSMKVKELRVIIVGLALDVKSTQKSVLIEAILKAQGGSSEDGSDSESSGDGAEEASSGDLADAAPPPAEG